jgi:hypothetical protein
MGLSDWGIGLASFLSNAVFADDPGYTIDTSVSYVDTGTSADVAYSEMTVIQGDELANPLTGQITGVLPGASDSSGIVMAGAGLALGTVSYVAGAEEGATAAPGFVVSPDGTVFPVPDGATGPVTTEGPGFQYNGGQGGNGLAGNVTDVRFMDPNSQNPSGYVNYGSQQANGGWQSVNPYTGVPVDTNNPMWHIPMGID